MVRFSETVGQVGPRFSGAVVQIESDPNQQGYGVRRNDSQGRRRRPHVLSRARAIDESMRRLPIVGAPVPSRRPLEHKLQPELNDARITSHWNRSCDSPDVGTVGGYAVVNWRRARDVEVHLVEDVEELNAELNVDIIVVTKVLEQPDIPGVE